MVYQILRIYNIRRVYTNLQICGQKNRELRVAIRHHHSSSISSTSTSTSNLPNLIETDTIVKFYFIIDRCEALEYFKAGNNNRQQYSSSTGGGVVIWTAVILLVHGVHISYIHMIDRTRGRLISYHLILGVYTTAFNQQ